MQERATLDKKVSYYESPTYAIARTLREKGYEIADGRGRRQTEPKHSVVGILKPRDPIQKSFLGIKWNKGQKALYLGTLWLNSQLMGARSDENWVLEVYGRENVPELTKLVEELSEPSSTRVQVTLGREQPKVETYPLFNWKDVFEN